MPLTHEITRRSVLQAAAGLGLSFVVPALDGRAADKRGTDRPKSLLVVWLAGGASQLETWDPHSGSATGGETKSIKTAISDVQIADLYPQVAEQLGAFNVIRSLVSKEGDHERGTIFMKTGYRPDAILTHPSLSAIVTHELPSPDIEIPQHVSLGDANMPARGGFLGDSLDAFRIYDPGYNLNNMRAHVSDERQQQRITSLDVVTKAFAQGRRLQASNTLHQLTVERALTMMSSEQLKAFQLDDEPTAIKAAYGDHRFGRGCLVARRLLETGVRAIEVTLSGWDTHANNYGGHVTQSKILDPALATLIQELKQRDLLQSTVVLCISEFGRTPKISSGIAGRDHWPKWFSCLVGGGGLQAGRVLGETDPDGSKDSTDPIQVQDLYATVLKTLGVEYSKEFITRIGRPIKFSSGQPIERLLG